MANVMAIGDAPNDIDMLEAAGIAVAMDNAHPAVKRIAPGDQDCQLGR